MRILCFTGVRRKSDPEELQLIFNNHFNKLLVVRKTIALITFVNPATVWKFCLTFVCILGGQRPELPDHIKGRTHILSSLNPWRELIVYVTPNQPQNSPTV